MRDVLLVAVEPRGLVRAPGCIVELLPEELSEIDGNVHVVLAHPVAFAVEQLEYVAEHCGGVRAVDLLNDEEVVLIGMGLRLDVALHEGSGDELIGDVGPPHVLGQRLVGLLLGPLHRRLVAAHEGGVAVVRVERDATRVRLIEVLPGEFVQAVRLAGAGGSKINKIIRKFSLAGFTGLSGLSFSIRRQIRVVHSCCIE